ncbi:MAG: ADP-glyceromanno-heptose 6-epimerase [Bacteroidetes bacterium]|nr:MAG: ADP-glyceromanno-heptose 6-epimerase [Bacteroidota bacterium]
MIVVTGAAGFIGSVLIGALNDEGITEIILVDKFGDSNKMKNLEKKIYTKLIERDTFIEWFKENSSEVDFIFHIGARSATTGFDKEVYDELNLNYTKDVWNICVEAEIPMIYASSAATYGDGEFGYDDDHSLVEKLKPLNLYGESKNDFDKWALKQKKTPPHWYGMKYFNVYGPNEFHKGRMASVIHSAFHQIKETGGMKLFKSHNPDYENGGQLRDFVYVKDVVEVMMFLWEYEAESGLYNVGTGNARSFLDLAKATFKAMGVKENITFIDTPIDIRDKYQYFTEANMNKLIMQGYGVPFYSLEDGVDDYVKEFLLKEDYY